ncbi:tol-pal system YbgF family protein [Flavobacterium sp.]|jgi:tetratricopeptide (TPR) repeat protein|uniref:tol-pal system YbgF family protein n=1 Tax=Flavobacterium sp. TaxID=239 RepID=UPI0037BEB7D9
MATYNKRGYKAPKEKEEKVDANFIEDTPNVDEKDSATAGVFNTLDETASKTEAWVEKNQKIIFGIVGAIALVTVSYLLYQKFVVEPKEDEGANAMFVAQQNFQKAVDGDTAKDSLFNLALKGSEGQFGFKDIADKFSGTAAGNLANYYAGIAYLNTGKYAEAISSLEKFSSDDVMLSTLAVGAIGDAYSQKNDAKKALEYYIKASEMNVNELTTPRYLLKAAQLELAANNKADALKHLTQIKEKYESAPEAQSVDALMGMAQ